MVLCLYPRLQKCPRKPGGAAVSLRGDQDRNSPAHAQSPYASPSPLMITSVRLAERSGSHGVGGATMIAANPAAIAEKSAEGRQNRS